MMNWAAADSPVHVTKMGEYFAAHLILTFDNTAAGPAGSTVLGQTYDPTNHYTTNPAFSDVAGKNLLDVCGFRYIVQVLDPDGSSSSTAKGTAQAASGSVKAIWSSAINAFILAQEGNGGAADNLTKQNELELDTTAGALSPLSFSVVVIGR
jgi:hypothetical protein